MAGQVQGMIASERQTAPPLSEVVSVTFRACFQWFEAFLPGFEVLRPAPSQAHRLDDARRAKGYTHLAYSRPVYSQLRTDLATAASAPRHPSTLKEGRG